MNNQEIESKVDALLAQMTPAEKIGQMTQPEKNSVRPGDVAALALGSVLSGGGGNPKPNTPAAWADMVRGFQDEALRSRLGIPLLYGVDAVHGHNNVYGATIFPHAVSLGATRDADLVRRVARATAVECAATGVRWDFAPMVSVVQDIRWGRTFEAFGDETALVAELSAAYVRGMQEEEGVPGTFRSASHLDDATGDVPEAGVPGTFRSASHLDDATGDVPGTPESARHMAAPTAVLATAKHYLGDGATLWGTSRMEMLGVSFILDQGDVREDEAALRRKYLPPYAAAVQAGVLTVMASFNSWQGLKVHANRHLLTDVLKGELGFRGFVVSDWMAVNQIDPDYSVAMRTAINAGLDMVMVPFDYPLCIATLTALLERGDIPMTRIDDAVRRILRVKFALGLFDRPHTDPALLARVGCAEHRALAREAVRRSVVLLRNEGGALPRREPGLLFVAGEAADDLGRQCGGWTIEWQGVIGRTVTEGTTLLEGLQQTAPPGTRLEFNRFGRFDHVTDTAGAPLVADLGLVVLHEPPYAEGLGDRADLPLSADDLALLERVRARCRRVAVILLTGRPVIITDALPLADAWVAAWWPGSEGAGVGDVLFGHHPFTGRLPFNWPRSVAQLPLDNLLADPAGPLFAHGYGLEE